MKTPTRLNEEDTMGKEIFVTQSSMPPFEEYVEMIKPLWEKRWLTNMGDYHKELEEQLKKFLKVQEISLTVNGHMALELGLQALELPRGGEVITTPFTFISTTHAIVRNGLTPIFCDVKDDYTIDEKKIESLITEKTVAIVPVHVYGNVCNVEEIERIAYKYNLKVLYDAAHAFGEKYKREGVGNFGDMSVFSFHATKVYHTIEGGCICTHSRELYEKTYNLKNFGIRNEELIVAVGANAKMNEFQAAMGLCNLKYLEKNILARKKVVERYKEKLNKRYIHLNVYNENIEPNYAYFPILFTNKDKRDEVYEALRNEKIFSRKYFYPITADAACFRNKYKNSNLEKARYFADRILVLPLYAELPLYQVDRIANIVNKVVEEKKI